jgi:hypothetical protein
MPSSEHIGYDIRKGLWIVGHDFTMTFSVGGGFFEDWVIPEGYETDLASIPRLLWFVMAPFEIGIEECILHDDLYKKCFRDRKFCDDVWLVAMRRKGVKKWKRETAYRFVRAFGWYGWNKHMKAKAKETPLP